MADQTVLPVVYNGQCPCKAVRFELTVDNWDNVTQIYCHCADCRRWHSSPFVFEVIVPKGLLKIIEGQDSIVIRRQTPNGCYRGFCKVCGTRVTTGFGEEVPVEGVFPSLFPSFPFKASIHLYYSEKIVSIKDGLPKYKRCPPEMGGDCSDVLPE